MFCFLDIAFAANLKGKSIKVFVSIIRALNFISNTEMEISQAGMKYIAEESKSFQATGYIKAEFFNSFNIKLPAGVESISFGINLNAFTDLLTTFLDNDLGSMNILYYLNKKCISFTFSQIDTVDASNKTKQQNTLLEGFTEEDEEPAGEINTEYFITTMQSIEPIDFIIENPQLMSSLIFTAHDFYSVINDLDRSIDGVEIKITNRRMTINSVGTQFAAAAKFPSTCEIFEKFEVASPSRFVYKFSYFKSMLKSLALASKMAIDTHIDGLVKIQLMARSEDDGTTAFIEFFLVPDLPDSDDDQDNE